MTTPINLPWRAAVLTANLYRAAGPVVVLDRYAYVIEEAEIESDQLEAERMGRHVHHDFG